MRKLLLLLLALSSASWGQISYVNGQSANSQSATTSIGTPPFNVAGGNLLVVGCRTSTNVAPTVDDTAGNTFSNPAACSISDASGDSVWLFYAKNVIGNANDVITCHYSSQSFTAVIGLQFSGAHTTAPFDVCQHGDDSSAATSITSAPFTPSAAGNTGVAFGSIGALGTTESAGTGYSIPATIGQTDFFGSEYKLSLAAGSQTTLMSWTGGTADTQIVVGSFKPAGGAALGFNKRQKLCRMNEGQC